MSTDVSTTCKNNFYPLFFFLYNLSSERLYFQFWLYLKTLAVRVRLRCSGWSRGNTHGIAVLLSQDVKTKKKRWGAETNKLGGHCVSVFVREQEFWHKIVTYICECGAHLAVHCKQGTYPVPEAACYPAIVISQKGWTFICGLSQQLFTSVGCAQVLLKAQAQVHLSN